MPFKKRCASESLHSKWNCPESDPLTSRVPALVKEKLLDLVGKKESVHYTKSVPNFCNSCIAKVKELYLESNTEVEGLVLEAMETDDTSAAELPASLKKIDLSTCDQQTRIELAYDLGLLETQKCRRYAIGTLHIYAQFKKQYNTEKYCNLNLKRSQRSLIAKLRLGILPIRVETGRYNNTIRQERICLICNNGNIEDEYHVMFYCEVYKASRSTLLTYASQIEKDFRTFNDTQKLEFLTTNINLIRKTACFIQIILKMRQMSLNTS